MAFSIHNDFRIPSAENSSAFKGMIKRNNVKIGISIAVITIGGLALILARVSPGFLHLPKISILPMTIVSAVTTWIGIGALSYTLYDRHRTKRSSLLDADSLAVTLMRELKNPKRRDKALEAFRAGMASNPKACVSIYMKFTKLDRRDPEKARSIADIIYENFEKVEKLFPELEEKEHFEMHSILDERNDTQRLRLQKEFLQAAKDNEVLDQFNHALAKGDFEQIDEWLKKNSILVYKVSVNVAGCYTGDDWITEEIRREGSIESKIFKLLVNFTIAVNGKYTKFCLDIFYSKILNHEPSEEYLSLFRKLEESCLKHVVDDILSDKPNFHVKDTFTIESGFDRKNSSEYHPLAEQYYNRFQILGDPQSNFGGAYAPFSTSETCCDKIVRLIENKSEEEQSKVIQGLISSYFNTNIEFTYIERVIANIVTKLNLTNSSLLFDKLSEIEFIQNVFTNVKNKKFCKLTKQFCKLINKIYGTHIEVYYFNNLTRSLSSNPTLFSLVLNKLIEARQDKFLEFFYKWIESHPELHACLHIHMSLIRYLRVDDHTAINAIELTIKHKETALYKYRFPLAIFQIIAPNLKLKAGESVSLNLTQTAASLLVHELFSSDYQKKHQAEDDEAVLLELFYLGVELGSTIIIDTFTSKILDLDQASENAIGKLLERYHSLSKYLKKHLCAICITRTISKIKKLEELPYKLSDLAKLSLISRLNPKFFETLNIYKIFRRNQFDLKDLNHVINFYQLYLIFKGKAKSVKLKNDKLKDLDFLPSREEFFNAVAAIDPSNAAHIKQFFSLSRLS